MRPETIYILSGLLIAGRVSAQEASRFGPPDIPREFRGTWVATVANINWPSKPGLSVTAQKAELIAILDTAKELNLNAILFQVRPACDAIYRSELEPWSEYLTGTMGKAPEPEYDPLEFAVASAHRRGLQLHAWFNPFRARHHSAKSPVAPNHITKLRPDLVHRYGTYLWLDPGEPAAREHTLKVIQDVVRRYDIDGVHFDDYFYPYPEKDVRGGYLPFPDSETWKKYGSGLGRAAWRRRNVDQFVRKVQQQIHREKPWVQFGISPFGIWRPGNPKSVKGLDAYDSLYADARKWLREGWVDYMAPQLYWTIDAPGQSFADLLEWWDDQNLRKRHLWIGLNTVKVGNPWSENELFRQITLTHQYGLHGHVHWNISKLMENPSFAKRLKARFYSQRALPPASKWLGATSPARPKLEFHPNPRRAHWTPEDGQPVWEWVLQTRTDTNWNAVFLPANVHEYSLTNSALDEVSLRAMDRCGNLSEAECITIPR